jgi:hypothetical protein
MVYSLTVWRVSFMLIYDHGPWGMFRAARERFGVLHDEAGEPISWPIGSVLACISCMSVWVAAAFWFIPEPVRTPFFIVLGAAGAAKLIQGWYESR